jgi:hypothetical protein
MTIYSTIQHLQCFRGAAEFLRQDVRLTLQRRQGARVDGQGAIEIGQRGARILVRSPDAAGDPALVVGRLSLAGLSAIRGGSGGISRFLSGLRSHKVDTGVRGPEFERAGEIRNRLGGLPRPQSGKRSVDEAVCVFRPQLDRPIEISTGQGVLPLAQMSKPALEVPGVEVWVEGDTGRVAGYRLSAVVQTVVAAPQTIPDPDILRRFPAGL